MAFIELCCNWAHRAGKFVGKTSCVFATKDRDEPEELSAEQSERLRIRRIVVQEANRLMGTKGAITREEFDERLQHLVTSIVSLQQKIDELRTQGPVTEAALYGAIETVSAAEPLDEEEKAVLASIFRQNVAIQRPELVRSGASKQAS